MGTNISEIPAAYIYYAEDESLRFLLSVGTYLAKYMALHPEDHKLLILQINVYLHKNIRLFLNNTLCILSPCTLPLLLEHSYQSWPGFGIHVLVACV
jgi:hypothetical protein